jgi:hypothetical protein
VSGLSTAVGRAHESADAARDRGDSEQRGEARRAETVRSDIVERLTADLANVWRGWYFWRVTTGGGGYDPVTVANTWPMIAVVETAFGLAMRDILESI